MRLRNAGAQIAPTSRQVQYAHQRDQSSLYLVGACARFAILLCGAPKQQSFVSVVPTPDPDLVFVRLAMLRSLLDTYRKPPQMTRVVQIGRQPTRYGEVRGSILTHLMVICSSLSAALASALDRENESYPPLVLLACARLLSESILFFLGVNA